MGQPETVNEWADWVLDVGLFTFRFTLCLGLTVYLVLLITSASFPGLDGGWIRHDLSSVLVALGASGILVALAFPDRISAFLRDRSIVVAKDRLELTKLADLPADLTAGTMRDNLIYLGGFHLYHRRYRAAFQYYAGAHRLSKSILTAYRCMQSLSATVLDQPVPPRTALLVRLYFDDSLYLLRGPRSDLERTPELVDWVRQRRDLVGTTDYAAILVTDLKSALSTEFGATGGSTTLAPASDW